MNNNLREDRKVFPFSARYKLDKALKKVYHLFGNTEAKMILTDIHTHTKFSVDGRSDIRDMIHRAVSLGLTYYGISEHFNYDYDRLRLQIDGELVPPIDEKAYFSCARKLQKEYSNKLTLLVGAEFGYDDASSTLLRYMDTAEKYSPDFIVNSVHTCLGMDCYFPHYCNGKSKEYAYNAYLYRVLESLDAPYPYDIVAHIGYCSRNATYPDAKLRYEDFFDVLDLILKRNPNAVVVALSAFCGGHKEALEELIPAYNKEHGTNVHFVNGSEWIPPQPLHPLRDGHRIVADHLAPALKEIFKL